MPIERKAKERQIVKVSATKSTLIFCHSSENSTFSKQFGKHKSLLCKNKVYFLPFFFSLGNKYNCAGFRAFLKGNNRP